MFDLELDKVVKLIEREKAEQVLIQLPDGLKPRAKEIQEFLKQRTKAKIFFWAGSCYGSCDLPDVSGMDLMIQFGHSK